MNPVLVQCAWVALGGALGALARFGVGHWVRSLTVSAFPWSTFLINITGSLALGLLYSYTVQRAPSPVVSHFLMIGMLGAYTTFSTFELETWQLVERQMFAAALAYVAASVLVGFAGLCLGIWLGRAFSL